MAWVAPTTTTAITAGTTAGLFTFANPMTTIVINNESGQNAFVLFDIGAGQAAASGIGMRLSTGQAYMGLGDIGKREITTVSVWLETGATAASLKIHGAQS